MIILGIDPGLANTGWGVIEREGPRCRAIAYGCISTRAGDAVSVRLARIHDEMVDVVCRYAPAECAIESIYFGANARSAFATGQARGVALLATASRDLAVAEYSPAQVKSVVVGIGTADKNQVTFMVRALLGLDHDPKPDHAADALAIAVTHARLRDHAQLDAATARPAGQVGG